MLAKFSVENFRKYKKLDLKNLSRINIFVGANNAGKTSIIEAIIAFSCGTNLQSLFSMSMFHRTFDNITLFSPYTLAEMITATFFDYTQDFKFAFQGVVDEKNIMVKHSFKPSEIFSFFLPDDRGMFVEQHPSDRQNLMTMMYGGNSTVVQNYHMGRWTIQVNENEQKKYEIFHPQILPNNIIEKPIILARLEESFSHRNETENRMIFSILARKGLIPEFVEGLNSSFEALEIESIENIPYPDGGIAPIILRLKNKKIRPLYSFGDGLRRWFNILGGMVAYKHAVHCIEEIDSTFNCKLQGDLVPMLWKYANEYDNQLFVTTHNGEFLYNFLRCLKTDAGGDEVLREDIRVITLRDYSDETRSRVLDGEEAFEALENGLELRL